MISLSNKVLSAACCEKTILVVCMRKTRSRFLSRQRSRKVLLKRLQSDITIER
jgi:hypothetical protein